jgi:predicted dinucleotide-binding enzyme
MRIAVIGTGHAGRTLAQGFQRTGHDVVVGTRDPDATRAREEWLGLDVPLAALAMVAADADLVVNATNGGASLAALGEVGSDHFAGKVILDVANPLDFSQGFPPTLFVKDTDSLGEQIQRAFPDVRVVKSLNTMTAALMAEPARAAGGDHSVFVSGNDEDAKKAVIALLQSLGHTDVIDLGDLSTARGTEMLLPIWLRLMGALGTAMFNFKIAR